MKEEFNRSDLAAIKRAAASIAPLITKRSKLFEKREDINIQISNIQNKINSFNAPIIEMTGYGADDIVVRDDNGKFVLRFPDTIIPPKVDFEAEEIVTSVDDTAVVDEIETTPAEAPFNPIN